MQKIILAVVFIFILVFILGKCKGKSKPEDTSDVEYMAACQKMIKQQANYPATVDHKHFSTSAYRAPNGNIVVTAPFSAKNAFGVEVDAKARCVFASNGETEITIIQD
jgi:hypothetical protein